MILEMTELWGGGGGVDYPAPPFFLKLKSYGFRPYKTASHVPFSDLYVLLNELITIDWYKYRNIFFIICKSTVTNPLPMFKKSLALM